MAKFFELKYYEDTTEKHEITEEEIAFLKNLQKELNTQDNIGQADPRYWVIRDYKKIYGKEMNNPDGISIFDMNGSEMVCEAEYQLFKVEELSQVILKEMESSGFDLDEDQKELISSSYDIENLCDSLEELDLGLSIVEYEEYPVEIGFFLTHKAAQDHLRLNDYHYSDKAHTYAHTAWRSSEEKLWSILQKVDFDKLNLYYMEL